jgi:hypothetical protein
MWEPMLRHERVRAVQEWLGQDASWTDAELVLCALEMEGFQIVRNLDSYPFRPVIVPELDERQFWKITDRAVR